MMCLSSSHDSIEFSLAKKVSFECQDDLGLVCGMGALESPYMMFQARYCLRANEDSISFNCRNLVQEIYPTLIETCYDDIQSYCKAMKPNIELVEECLRKVQQQSVEKQANSLSGNCVKTLADQQYEKMHRMQTKDDFYNGANQDQLQEEEKLQIDEMKLTLNEGKLVTEEDLEEFSTVRVLTEMISSTVRNSFGKIYNNIVHSVTNYMKPFNSEKFRYLRALNDRILSLQIPHKEDKDGDDLMILSDDDRAPIYLIHNGFHDRKIYRN